MLQYCGAADLCRVGQLSHSLRALAGQCVLWEGAYACRWGAGAATKTGGAQCLDTWQKLYGARALVERHWARGHFQQSLVFARSGAFRHLRIAGHVLVTSQVHGIGGTALNSRVG